MFRQENIKKLAIANTAFQKVVFTGKHAQLVLMTLAEGDHIGEEMHELNDELYFVIDGMAEAFIDGKPIKLEESDMLFVPAGTKHDIKNTGRKELKLYNIYSPPVLKEGLVKQTHPKGEKLTI